MPARGETAGPSAPHTTDHAGAAAQSAARRVLADPVKTSRAKFTTTFRAGLIKVDRMGAVQKRYV